MYVYIYMYIYIYTYRLTRYYIDRYGDFHKWGYPKMDGL